VLVFSVLIVGSRAAVQATSALTLEPVLASPS
jgi:hypothetical protein